MRIGDRLAAARSRQMVGRDAELALFRTVLEEAEEPPPFSVLYISGPGGVGKTTLLRALIALCEEAGAPHLFLDARNIEPSPDAFLQALRQALSLPSAEDPLSLLASENERRVLFIDTYENLELLDAWVRDVFVPQLSGETLVVLSGRNPPSSYWLSDDAWQSMLHAISLRNFSPPESREYLTRRGVPDIRQRAAVEFTHGYPLALSLLADVFAQHGSISNQLVPILDAVPDVVQALLERFLRDVPSSLHRAALEASALLRLTDEPLLAHMLSHEEENAPVREIFQWMRGLSFMETGDRGIFPHDIAREALLADLRWRHRERYVDLHGRARSYYVARLPSAEGREQQRLLYDSIFLHRDNAIVRAAFTWNETLSVFPDTFRDEDRDTLMSMVARHEGQAGARIAGYWLDRQPEATLVFRERSPASGRDAVPAARIVGFLMLLKMEECGNGATEDSAADPAIAAAWKYLERIAEAPLRSGEEARYLRFWMAADTYQEPSPVQSLIIVQAFRHFIMQSRVAFTFISCRDAEFWDPVLSYMDIPRLRDAEFSLGSDKSFGVYGHDWRARSAAAWLEHLARNETEAGESSLPSSAPPRSEPLLVLSEPDFTAAVLTALRGFTNAEILRRSPLLRSRLVASRTGEATSPEEKINALQAVIREAAQSLLATPRTARGSRVVHHTYLEPAPTQEQAAEMLDLPFSTYRRHLAEGITLVTDLLWQQEIGATQK